MKTSEAGIKFLKDREAFRAVPYKDTEGNPTIGFGHLIRQGELFGALSSVEATALLERDVSGAENCINNFVKEPLTQNEFDALVSFVFNVGEAAFKGSTMLKLLNIGEFDLAANEFLKWCHDREDGVYVINRGLQKRRIMEKAMFLS
jgi:lysozyme